MEEFEETKEIPLFDIRSEIECNLESFRIFNESENEKAKAHVIDTKINFRKFLDDLNQVADNDQVMELFHFFNGFLSSLKPNNFHIEVSEIDACIIKLIDLLNEIDLYSNFGLIKEILKSLNEISRIYSFFGKSENIQKLNSFLVNTFTINEAKEIRYFILEFLTGFYSRFYDQSNSIAEAIFPVIFSENDSYLFEFLPTKENEPYQSNPILSLLNTYIHHSLQSNSPFMPNIQIIINNSMNYIDKCEGLLIPIEEEEFDYEIIEPIYEINQKIGDHISNCLFLLSKCIDTLGQNFFKLYLNDFPVHYLEFFTSSFFDSISLHLQANSLHFLYVCVKSGIDISRFYHNEALYYKLVKLLRNAKFFSKSSHLIYLMISLNPELSHHFIEAEIEKSNAFEAGENFRENLNNIRLISVIVHNYPAKSYTFGVDEMIHYLVKILMPQESEVSSFVFQIFIDMFNHFDKLGRIEEFLGYFHFYNSKYEMMDEYLNNDLLDNTQQLVSLFSEMLGKYHDIND